MTPHPGDHAPNIIRSRSEALRIAAELRVASLPAFMREQIEKDAPLIDAAFGPKRFARNDDGLGRRVSCTDLHEGACVWCPRGLRGYGLRKEADSIAPGSIGTVHKVAADWTVAVEFYDAETGEAKIVDCVSTDLRWPVDAGSVATTQGISR